MTYSLFLIFGILPSIVWLAFYLRRDTHPEPIRMVLKIFILGMLATIPAIFLELLIRCSFSIFSSSSVVSIPSCMLAIAGIAQSAPSSLPSFPALSPLFSILYIFVGVALIEEFLKYAVVRWQIYSSPEFDEPIDLPLYMIIAALGFAAMENILILSGLGPAFLPIGIVYLSAFRFLGATLLHALVSGLFGYFLILSLMRKRFRFLYISGGLVLATTLHGLFNFFIIEVESPEKFLFPAIILFALALFVSFSLTRLQKIQGAWRV